MQLPVNRIVTADAYAYLKKLPGESVNMVMTSPPYWSLRDYGEGTTVVWDGDSNCRHQFEEHHARLMHENRQNIDGGTLDAKHTQRFRKGLHGFGRAKAGFCSRCRAWKGQLGLEPSFDLYVKHLCDVFDQVKRILRNDGTCWVNIGDTYGGSWQDYGSRGGGQRQKKTVSFQRGDSPHTVFPPSARAPAKCLAMIPFRFAIEMVNRGWTLRNVLIWHKPNSMPSSARDRFTVDFEYLLFFSKSKKYFFKTQLEQSRSNDKGRSTKTRYKRAVWKVATKPLPEAHFAVFPDELCEIPIQAGCPERGIVLDPFFGAGTTGLVALMQNKNFIGIELNSKYVRIAKKRLKPLLKNTSHNQMCA